MSQMFGEYLVPGQVIASTNYIFERILGRGGNGTALLVRDPLLDRRIVLKVLDKVSSEEVVGRFQLEGKILTRLEHRSIVKVHFAGPLVEAREGLPMRILPFLAIEYVEGETLASMLRREAPLPVPRALSMMAELLDGIDAAHQLGIIHRDIKPANVMVVRATGALKLLDFGVAKVVEQEQAASKQLTVAGTILGTPRYLSPEQAQATNVGPFTDIYSATVVLFEMLTGRTPFDGDIQELLYKHIYVTAPSLASVGAGGPFPPELEHLVAGQFAKDTTRRTQRAADLAAALRNIARQYTTTVDAGGGVRGDEPTLAIANPQAVFTDVTTQRKVDWPSDGDTVRDVRAPAGPALDPTVEVTGVDPEVARRQHEPRVIVRAHDDSAPPRQPAATVPLARPSSGRSALLAAAAAFIAGGLVVGILIWGRGESGKTTKASTNDTTPVKASDPSTVLAPPASNSVVPMAPTATSSAPEPTTPTDAFASAVPQAGAKPGAPPKKAGATAPVVAPPASTTTAPVASPPPAKSVSPPKSTASVLDPTSGFDDRQ